MLFSDLSSKTSWQLSKYSLRYLSIRFLFILLRSVTLYLGISTMLYLSIVWKSSESANLLPSFLKINFKYNYKLVSAVMTEQIHLYRLNSTKVVWKSEFKHYSLVLRLSKVLLETGLGSLEKFGAQTRSLWALFGLSYRYRDQVSSSIPTWFLPLTVSLIVRVNWSEIDLKTKMSLQNTYPC